MPARSRVLILFNAPSCAEIPFRLHRESDAGVLAEVNAVAEALTALGRTWRTAAVTGLCEAVETLKAAPEEIVFNLVESLPGDAFRAALIPALCEAFGKGCTGGGTPGLILAQNKWTTTRVLNAEGIHCPRGLLATPGDPVPEENLPGRRLIVKPAFGDASEGIHAMSVVEADLEALARAVGHVHRILEQPALIEEFVGERELNVSVIERDGAPVVLPIAEIDFAAFESGRPRIVSYEAKWLADTFEYKHTPRVIPAPLSGAAAERVRNVVLRAWNALECRDYARVDLRLTAADEPVVLEINPNPDISPDAGFAAALRAAGMDFAAFVALMIENAQRRVSPFQCGNPGGPPRDSRIRPMNTADIPAVLSLLEDTRAFRLREIAVAREVLCHAAASFEHEAYISYIAERGNRLVGWICFGETACTEGTFDIYWIAVAPSAQRSGLGRALIRHAVRHAAECGGRMMVVETSGREAYAGTRAFYEKNDFRLASRVPDFYAPGDDKVVYVLPLAQRAGTPENDAKACVA